MGNSDIEDALCRLDRLTQEEARMAAAQGLKAIHGVGDKVQGVDDKLHVVIDGAQIGFKQLLRGSHGPD
jgi:hypothetical protein